MPFRIEPTDILLILLAVLLLFGPNKLPEIGRGLGKAIREFRQGTKEMSDGFREENQSPKPAVPIATAQGTPTGNFCIQCGNPNPAEARFCSHCGSALPTI